MFTITKKSKNEMEIESIKYLKNIYKPGDTVSTALYKVSSSGMSRHIAVMASINGRVVNISYQVARALGYRLNKNQDALVVGGCGMDMGFSVAYNLSSALFKKGFSCIGEAKRCPSNDHSNGDRVYTKHLHKSGGYALRHSWL